jgi:hypothetical protein
MENNHNQQKMFSSGLPQIDHGSKFMDFFFGTASYNIWRWGTFLGLRGHNLDMFPIGIHQRESMLKTGFIFGRPFEQLFKNSSTWQGSPPRNSVAKVICDGEASTYCLLASRSGPWGHITMRSGYTAPVVLSKIWEGSQMAYIFFCGLHSINSSNSSYGFALGWDPSDFLALRAATEIGRGNWAVAGSDGLGTCLNDFDVWKFNVGKTYY